MALSRSTKRLVEDYFTLQTLFAFGNGGDHPSYVGAEVNALGPIRNDGISLAAHGLNWTLSGGPSRIFIRTPQPKGHPHPVLSRSTPESFSLITEKLRPTELAARPRLALAAICGIALARTSAKSSLGAYLKIQNGPVSIFRQALR